MRTQPIRLARPLSQPFFTTKPCSFSPALSRSLQTQTLNATRTTRSKQRPLLQQAWKRTYADQKPISGQAPQVKLSPDPQPKRRFKVFKTLWRITYISVLGGLGYLAYTIYDLQTPSQQMDPDPSKKTLVILGAPTDTYSRLLN